MSDVFRRNIKNNIQDQFIQNRLGKLMPCISGSYIPIRIYRMVQQNFSKKRYLHFGDWLDFWLFIINSLTIILIESRLTVRRALGSLRKKSFVFYMILLKSTDFSTVGPKKRRGVGCRSGPSFHTRHGPG